MRMRKEVFSALLAAAALGAMSLPLAAQSVPAYGHAGNSARHYQSHYPHRSSLPHHTNSPRYVFVPGFGLRPVVHERFPVSGQGFDAQHFFAVNPNRHAIGSRYNSGSAHGHGDRHRYGNAYGHGNRYGSGSPYGHGNRNAYGHGNRYGIGNPYSLGNRYRYGSGIRNRGVFGNNSLGVGYPPASSLVSSGSSIVVVPQGTSTQTSSTVTTFGGNAPAGLSATTSLANNGGTPLTSQAGCPTGQQVPAQNTLLVLKDQSMLAVTDYRVEDGRLSYVTSTGRQDSVPLDDLDLEATSRLNGGCRIQSAVGSAR